MDKIMDERHLNKKTLPCKQNRAKLDCSFFRRVGLLKEFAFFGYFTKPQVATANNGDH